MHLKLIEGTNPDGPYLKAAICTFDRGESHRKSLVADEVGHEVNLPRQGTWNNQDFWILPISRPGPGGKFNMGPSTHSTSFQPHFAPHDSPVEWPFHQGRTTNFPLDPLNAEKPRSPRPDTFKKRQAAGKRRRIQTRWSQD